MRSSLLVILAVLVGLAAAVAFGHYVSWVPVYIIGGIVVGVGGYVLWFSMALGKRLVR